jgi:spore maturation protein CgeB
VSSLTILQTRTSTPNYYLFQDFCRALEGASKKYKIRTAVSGLDAPKKLSQILLCFGGEELLTPVNLAHINHAEKKIAWFTEDPYERNLNKENENYFDLVLTTDVGSKEHYSVKTEVLPLAAPARLFENQAIFKKDFDILVFGSLWPNRIDILDAIVSQLSSTKLRILLVTSQSTAPWVDQEKTNRLFSEVEKFGGRVLLASRPYSLNQMKYFAQISKIVLNWPRFFAGDNWSVPGPRIFEIAASGTTQLLDVGAQPGIRSIIPNDAYIEYNHLNLKEVLDSTLSHDSRVSSIGERMFDLVRKEHTWEKRALDLLDLIEKKF